MAKAISKFKTSGPLHKRVLIADTNNGKFFDLIQSLSQAGIETLFTNDRTTLVPSALDFQPDLIIVNLFIGSGTSLPQIRELSTSLERYGTKIVVLTSHQSKDNLAECVKAGADDFIIEPFDTRQILQRVKYQLQEREAYSPDDLRAEPTQVPAGFQLVYDCLRILAEIKETGRAVYEVLKRVSELSQSPRVNLIMADITSNKGIVMGASDDPDLNSLEVDLEKYPETREVLLRGSIVYVKDIMSNPLTRDIRANVKDINITSLLVFPIRHRQETLGTLNIRLGAEGLAVSDKHLKTFYMVALMLAPKMATRKLLKRIGQDTK